METFVSRTLTFVNANGKQERITDRALLKLSGPVVILGEPGSGKTWLLRSIADHLGARFRSAASFVIHPDPAQLAVASMPLVIDGLDELAAARESDPINRVLRQLILAGCPSFFLSCRAADWRGAAARQDILDEYGAPPMELFVEPLTHDSAVEFLSQTMSAHDAQGVVDYLDARALPDLYGNPLTLRLFSEVAGDTTVLPERRADLLRRACEVMWNERNDRHDRSPLSSLDMDTALDATGAAFAALILTGATAMSTRPSAVNELDLLQASKIRSLPGGINVNVVMGSRLFVPGDDSNQFKPLHRSIAEYLGARWLARSTNDDLARERLLAYLVVDGGVPASLRGIHAWLAHFDSHFTAPVILADPYGVLRYGDADGLSPTHARLLLKSLRRLESEDPFFRAGDWAKHSAGALTHETLSDDIRDAIHDPKTTYHLRTLLLEALQGSSLSIGLADDLQTIMLNTGEHKFVFGERRDAAQALARVPNSSIDWPSIVVNVSTRKDQASRRLGLLLLEDVGYEKFGPSCIAQVVLGYLGLLRDQTTEDEDSSSVGDLFLTSRRLPDDLVGGVLDELAARVPAADPVVDSEIRDELRCTLETAVCSIVSANGALWPNSRMTPAGDIAGRAFVLKT